METIRATTRATILAIHLQVNSHFCPCYVLTLGGTIRWPWRQPSESHPASSAFGGEAADAAHSKAAVEIVGAAAP